MKQKNVNDSINANRMTMTNLLICILAGALAAMSVALCWLCYAIGSRDDRLAKLSNENRDLRDVILDMESELQRGARPPGGSAATTGAMGCG